MPDESAPHDISGHEHIDRAHNAEQHAAVPAVTGDEGTPRANETPADTIARAAGAIGPDTETDPLRLMQYDDRPGQSDGRR